MSFPFYIISKCELDWLVLGVVRLMLVSFLLKELEVFWNIHLFHHSSLLIFATFHLLCVYVHACICVAVGTPCCMYGNKRTSLGSHFSPSTISVLQTDSAMQAWSQAPTHDVLAPRLHTYLPFPLYFIPKIFPSLSSLDCWTYPCVQDRRCCSTTASFASLTTYLHCRKQCYCLWIVCQQPGRCN